MKRKLFYIISILMTIAIVVIFSQSVYGWFTNATKSASFSIKSANVSSSITLYEGIDNNKDGILELTEDGLDSYGDGVKYLPPTQEAIYLEITQMIPTEVYTWKITVENQGDVDAYVSFLLDDTIFYNLSDEQIALLKCLKITIYDSVKQEKSKTSLIGSLEDNVLFGGDIDEKVDKPAYDATVGANVFYSIDYILQIELDHTAVISSGLNLQNLVVENVNLFNLVLSSEASLDETIAE